MASSTDLAWAAGFFDGEGCIRIYTGKHTKHGALSIDAGQANPEPLVKLQSLFGGSIARYDDRRASRRPAFKWRCSTNQAEQALSQMLPWLIVKQDEALLGLMYQAMVHLGGTPGRKGLPVELREARIKIASDLVLLKHRRW